jgi:cyclophilin family peptidyl-prolyl cis-trans isomerase
MARATDPNSAGSQFFIVLNDSQFLDNQYTVFGRVTEGMNTVDKIASVPTNERDQPADPEKTRIKSVRIKEE